MENEAEPTPGPTLQQHPTPPAPRKRRYGHQPAARHTSSDPPRSDPKNVKNVKVVLLCNNVSFPVQYRCKGQAGCSNFNEFSFLQTKKGSIAIQAKINNFFEALNTFPL